MTFDAFRHVPALRQRIKPAEASSLRVTPEVMAAWDERARLLGREADWRQSDAQLDASCRQLLASIDDAQALWIFAYGSLMWDPGFHFSEVRRADLPGHQRRFLFRTALGRGSPELPGLMLSLEPAAGLCQGLAFCIPPQWRDIEFSCLWRREMIRGSYRPALRSVATPQGEITALVFAANPAHPDHVGELPLAETARIVGRAAGFLGSNREYLEQLAAELESLGVEDEYVTRLQQQVAAAAPA